MRLRNYIIASFLFFAWSIHAQHYISIDATLQTESKSLDIQQTIVYKNNSKEVLDEIYINDWANSFSSKTTPLGQRFSENYSSDFHFEKDHDRGKTTIESISNESNDELFWERGNEVDIIKVNLDNPLLPGDRFTLKFKYNVKLPDVKFTRFGVTQQDDYNLQYWYLSPAVFDGKWHAYSNKKTDDLYLTPSSFEITMHSPKEYGLVSDFKVISEKISEGIKTTLLEGDNRTSATIYLEQIASFENILTDKFEVITNIKEKKVTPPIRAIVIDRITHFLSDKLGEYPFEKMVISDEDYRSSPVYGLNQLPDFISPFPDGFEYDMEQLKTITRNYLQNTLQLHPRKDYWLLEAIQIHLMMEYVDTYYPNMKIIGSLSKFWIIRWAHAAELEFNDQYPMLYLNMARNNIHQKLTTSRDSLIKFNKNIANAYYGGKGLDYLSSYLGGEVVDKSIKEFFSENKLKPVKSSKFQEKLKQHTDLPIDWFFEDFADSREYIDFKIKKATKEGDSLKVLIKNLRNNTMPVSLFGLNKEETVFKKWVLPIEDTITVMVPSKDVRKLAVNYDGEIPEYNRRNNFKKVKGLLNKPIQLRLFQDVEDPNYTQFFFMPIFEYNLYDGITTGIKLYNKTVLPKAIHYKLEPQYGLRSKTIIGSGSIRYTQRLAQGNLNAMRYGFSGNYYSYDEGLFYKRFTPYINFSFRDPDLRKNEKQYINLRNVNVHRDDNPNDPDQEPNYSVFDVSYVYSNPNQINYFRGVVDYQISSKFSKISTTLEYRKLFNNNRQLNLRFFAGTFIFNDTASDQDFFSFALDRPTDYLFDYSYYGRSEDTGLFSQQLVVAEGGFKSQLTPAFSNSWITTINASTNIWRWIYAYGDVGLVNNKGLGTKALFDSGIRVNLVADYFELYFPIYSSLGFEPNLPNYDEKVRFIITLSPKTLLGLFTREWY